MVYDVAIIGAGPAGLCAALYLARRKLKTIIISKEIGGQTIWSGNIENYLGFKSLTGIELIIKTKTSSKASSIATNLFLISFALFVRLKPD